MCKAVLTTRGFHLYLVAEELEKAMNALKKIDEALLSLGESEELNEIGLIPLGECDYEDLRDMIAKVLSMAMMEPVG